MFGYRRNQLQNRAGGQGIRGVRAADMEHGGAGGARVYGRAVRKACPVQEDT